MTVTRDPAGGTPPEGGVDDTELAALEAAEAQARGNARRAAQALKAARRSRAGAAAPAAPATDDAAVDDVVESPPTAHPAPTAAVTNVEPDLVDDDLDGSSVDADEAVEDSGAEPRRRRARPRRATVIALVAAVLAAVFVVVSAFVYHDAQGTRSSSPAAARDASLLAARQDIVVLNTLDYTDIDAGLQRWLGATTGTLRDRLSTVSDADRQAIAASKSVTTASVLAAAVTQVDADKGTSTVIASVQVQVKPATGNTVTKRIRFSIGMVEVGDAWKVGQIDQIGVKVT